MSTAKVTELTPFEVIFREDICAVLVKIDLRRTGVKAEFGEFLGMRMDSPLSFEFKVNMGNLMYFVKEELRIEASLCEMMAASTITQEVISYTWNNVLLAGAPVINDHLRCNSMFSSYLKSYHAHFSGDFQ
jgi:hypothetical protein